MNKLWEEGGNKKETEPAIRTNWLLLHSILASSRLGIAGKTHQRTTGSNGLVGSSRAHRLTPKRRADRQTDRQTDKTDGQTDRQTDKETDGVG